MPIIQHFSKNLKKSVWMCLQVTRGGFHNNGDLEKRLFLQPPANKKENIRFCGKIKCSAVSDRVHNLVYLFPAASRGCLHNTRGCRIPADWMCIKAIENLSRAQVTEKLYFLLFPNITKTTTAGKYLGVLFTSEGRTEWEIDRRISAAAAVMGLLCRS
ncbi:hypothetical protein ATANTOWER_003669, partial [Ataeniobius toweri]|nr:hypothetical protein [Ataeniobius toweri]